MTPNRGQREAIEAARTLKSFEGKPRVVVLAGCAGTGKSSCLRFIAEDLGYPTCVAPTGKAAVRVREASGLGARTIHSFLYDAEEDQETGEVTWRRKPADHLDVSHELPVVVVDEASMVGLDLWDDLYDACSVAQQNLLVVGDPFQLPPVENSSSGQSSEFSLLSPAFSSDCRVELTVVMRQALESPVLRAATLVRQGKFVEAVMGLPRCPPRDFVSRASECDAVICHKNQTRLDLDVRIRRAMGRPEGELVYGEPLLIRVNSYGAGAFNGEVWPFSGWEDHPGGEHVVNDWIRKRKASSRFGVARVGAPEQSVKVALSLAEVFGALEGVSRPAIHKTSRVLYGVEEYDPLTRQTVLAGPPHLHANLGYALTAHASQGSEWRSVAVAIEPSVQTRTVDGLRWAYTAMTRAKEELLVCLGTP